MTSWLNGPRIVLASRSTVAIARVLRKPSSSGLRSTDMVKAESDVNVDYDVGTVGANVQ